MSRKTHVKRWRARLREVEAEVAEEADKRAREIVTMAIERIASDHVSEYAVSSVDLPSDEMKGRIIGRQGRNIRAIEQAVGVDLVVDDTPEAIIISSFDPIRREVARMALSKLVADGRIHPTRIEKEVEQARHEVDRMILEAGEQATIETNTQGIHREILKLLGRLKFRTSYGQNQLYHAIETAHIAAMIASELHANVKVAGWVGFCTTSARRSAMRSTAPTPLSAQKLPNVMALTILWSTASPATMAKSSHSLSKR